MTTNFIASLRDLISFNICFSTHILSQMGQSRRDLILVEKMNSDSFKSHRDEINTKALKFIALFFSNRYKLKLILHREILLQFLQRILTCLQVVDDHSFFDDGYSATNFGNVFEVVARNEHGDFVFRFQLVQDID